MLRLATLTIRNFRSIYDETFMLPPLAAFVGKNDAGKSNIIEAIDILLEGSKDSVSVSDFYDAIDVCVINRHQLHSGHAPRGKSRGVGTPPATCHRLAEGGRLRDGRGAPPGVFA